MAPVPVPSLPPGACEKRKLMAAGVAAVGLLVTTQVLRRTGYVSKVRWEAGPDEFGGRKRGRKLRYRA